MAEWMQSSADALYAGSKAFCNHGRWSRRVVWWMIHCIVWQWSCKASGTDVPKSMFAIVEKSAGRPNLINSPSLHSCNCLVSSSASSTVILSAVRTASWKKSPELKLTNGRSLCSNKATNPSIHSCYSTFRLHNFRYVKNGVANYAIGDRSLQLQIHCRWNVRACPKETMRKSKTLTYQWEP